MAAKLPDAVISRWCRVVSDMMEESEEYPCFADFVHFVEREARIATHPAASFTAVKALCSNAYFATQHMSIHRCACCFLATPISSLPSAGMCDLSPTATHA